MWQPKRNKSEAGHLSLRIKIENKYYNLYCLIVFITAVFM